MTVSGSRQIHIGISGWRYPPWRGTFYPKDLPQKCELSFASRQVNSIEINGSFYALQLPTSYRKWYQSVPDDFVFSVKGGRFITHTRRLKDVKIPLANFFASGIFELREKLGAILWQLPPSFKYNGERLENFFQLLPRDTEQAEKLARKQDGRLRGRARLRAWVPGKLRHALEVRHESFKCPEFIDLLRANDIALVIADTAGKWPFFEDITSDFLYLRLHGDAEIYTSGYTEKALDRWADRIKLWTAGREPEDRKTVSPVRASPKFKDAFVYFDNDVKVRAPIDAISLLARLKSLEQNFSRASVSN